MLQNLIRCISIYIVKEKLHCITSVRMCTSIFILIKCLHSFMKVIFLEMNFPAWLHSHHISQQLSWSRNVSCQQFPSQKSCEFPFQNISFYYSKITVGNSGKFSTIVLLTKILTIPRKDYGTKREYRTLLYYNDNAMLVIQV